MGPRIVLYTGRGGVGTTSVAAATARRIASGGRRTVVLSSDPVGSLADVLAHELGPEPTSIGHALWGQQVDARGGPDARLALLEIRRHAEGGDFDCVVVDCGSPAEALRLLALPGHARRWLARGAAEEPAGMDAADVRALVALNEVLRDGQRVSVRLVTTPERIAIAEARRTATFAGLHGFPTDALVVNRLLPAGAGHYFAAWRAGQHEQLAEIESAFAPLPVLTAPFLAEEVRGAAMVDRLGDALFAGRRAEDLLHTSVPERVELGPDGASLRLALPFARREDVTLHRAAPSSWSAPTATSARWSSRPPCRATGRRRPVSPTGPSPSASMSGPAPEDPLAALREAVRTAQEAAARLTVEAQRLDGAPDEAVAETQAVAAVLHTARGLVPEEVRGELAELVRQLLLLVRAVLDWWVAGLEPAGGGAPGIEEIPVE